MLSLIPKLFKAEPTAAIIDSRTLRATPENGQCAGYDGAKRKRGSKVHMAVNTLDHLLALHMTAADVGDRKAVARLAANIEDATGDGFARACRSGLYGREAAATEGIRLNGSSCLKPSAASYFSPGGRLWSVPLPGAGIDADWSRFASAMPQPLPDSKSLPPSDACSKNHSFSSEVHNTLYIYDSGIYCDHEQLSHRHAVRSVGMTEFGQTSRRSRLSPRSCTT
jgi:hypothetical protein